MKKILLLLVAACGSLFAQAETVTLTTNSGTATWEKITTSDGKAGYTATYGDITLSYNQNTSTTAPVAPSSDMVKLYKNYIFSISTPGTITEVVFHCSEPSTYNGTTTYYAMNFTVDGVETTTAETTTNTVTWTGSSSDWKATMTGGQCRVKSIDITYTTDPNVVSVSRPTIEGDASFTETTTCTMTAAEGCKIYYSYSEADFEDLDDCILYKEPLTISKTTTIYAMAVDAEGHQSGIAKKTFTKLDVITVAEALEKLVDATSSFSVCVKGFISKIDAIDTSSFGNATYYISDDGTTDNHLQVFRGYSVDGAKFTSATEITVGDEVIVLGTIIYYNGKTKEFQQGSKIISLVKHGEAGEDISNTIETAYTVTEANTIIDEKPNSLVYPVYVKGIICKIDSESDTETGGFTSYHISLDGTEATEQFYVFGGYGINGSNLKKGDLKVGDDVVVYGSLINYNGTKEFQKGNKIVKIVRNGEDITTGIEGVTTSTAKAAIYDLQGRQLRNAQKGINIINGKKMMVK